MPLDDREHLLSVVDVVFPREGRARLGFSARLVKNAHFSKQRRGAPGAGPYQVRAGWDGFAVNPGGAKSELRIIVGKGGDSETLLTSGIVSRV